MSKLMKSISMAELMQRIIGEKEAKESIYDIPNELTSRVLDIEGKSKGFKINNECVALPIGPAAGPHTQIAPNIIAAWLCGSRVFELKTVQQNDRLDIAKPCIDALDEGHNVEWSTELLLEEARAEYIRAYIALNILRAALADKNKAGSFIFNMSVGYTLDGIKSDRVDAFIEGMRAPKDTEIWNTAIKEAIIAVESNSFACAFGKDGQDRAKEAISNICPKPIHSLTLSTMHGCPPQEIEKIGSYFIEEKNFDSYIKLNPTLLGYDEARAILDRTSWPQIELARPTFEHDLQFDSALSLISSLRAKSKAKGLTFGIKLSNTLANVNNAARLPGAERYMSGRALFPLTTRLATRIAEAIPDVPAFSYCGGISSHNVYDALKAGLGPLTVATDILKPGGYMRLESMAKEAVRAINEGLPEKPDAAKLKALSEKALEDSHYRGDSKKGKAHIAKALPLTDCFAAPCVQACPANQRAPEYIKAMASGEHKLALSIILEDNPLPNLTGMICDHKCMQSCSRVDYEGAVDIRASKLSCAMAGEIHTNAKAKVNGKGKTAIFGAGPAGLSAAHYLSKEGYPVTVFEKANKAGGVPKNVIPEFRFDAKKYEKDIERIKSFGAEFVFNYNGKIDLEELKSNGYTSFVIACGAPVARELAIKGSGIKVVDALDFLESIHNGSKDYDSCKDIIVAGGGNTAMDAARVASRLSGKPEVSLLYRRTLAEMPADKDEYKEALEEGVKCYMLSLPEEIANDGKTLIVRKMELGEADESGRRSPVSGKETTKMKCDLIVAAIGETVDESLFVKLGVEVNKARPVVDSKTKETSVKGLYAVGDAKKGPASIISACADGRDAAFAILKDAGVEITRMNISAKKPENLKSCLSHRGEMLESLDYENPQFIKREAERCLSCESACLRCVEVCPNRANMAIEVPTNACSSCGGKGLIQDIQVLHIDELCNECGNCGFFCPYDGEPYSGKVTLFGTEEDIKLSKNVGFVFVGKDKPELIIRKEKGGELHRVPFEKWSTCENPIPSIARVVYTKHTYLLK